MALGQYSGRRWAASFNILVVAKAIVLGIIGTVLASTGLTNPSSPVLIAGSLFGMALTVLWWRFAVRGWKYMDIMVTIAQEFEFKGVPNSIQTWEEKHRATLRPGFWLGNARRNIANQVILLFGFAYVITLIEGVFLLIQD